MGTNYYWEPAPCPTCGRGHSKRIHIGKLSGGWEFIFHGTDAIRSWKDWKTVLSGAGAIYDEYGRSIAVADFIRLVDDQKAGGLSHYDYCRNAYPSWGESGGEWKDDDGNSFSSREFS